MRIRYKWWKRTSTRKFSWRWRTWRGRRIRYKFYYKYRGRRVTRRKWAWKWRVVNGKRIRYKWFWSKGYWKGRKGGNKGKSFTWNWKWRWSMRGGKRVRTRYRYKRYMRTTTWVWRWRWRWIMRGGKRVRTRYRYKHTKSGGKGKGGGGKTVKKTVVKKGKTIVKTVRKKIKTIRKVTRKTAKQRWRVKRTSNPQTWWSYRLIINRWRFSRRMSRTQGYWYLRRYSDLRKKFGSRNWKAAQTHWREFGIKERRNKLAYRDLNEWESKMYLERFSDVNWSTKIKMS